MRLVFVVLTFFSSISPAEYRAFRLRIENIKNPSEKREVLSNLDPLQYPGYYPLQADERISYTDTWMCFGRTNGKAICPDPKAPKVAEEPAP